MTKSQTLQLRMSEISEELGKLPDDAPDDARNALTTEHAT